MPMKNYKMLILIVLMCNFYYFVIGEKKALSGNLDTLKSLIYKNAKATVTLDSTALKELIKLSAPALFNPTQRVSFSVYVKSKVVTVGDKQTVVYDGILTNDGNGYDDRTGVFVCPMAGTYMFTLDSLSSARTWLHIKVNKIQVGSAHISNIKGSWTQISRTVIVKLNKATMSKLKVNTAHRYTTVPTLDFQGRCCTEI